MSSVFLVLARFHVSLGKNFAFSVTGTAFLFLLLYYINPGDIMARDKNLDAALKLRYPMGYILYGKNGITGNIEYKLNRLKVEADWEKNEIAINKRDKTVLLKIQKPIWTKEGGQDLHIDSKILTMYRRYKVGQPIMFRVLEMDMQPKMYLEILDDDENHPTYVIGFKMD